MLSKLIVKNVALIEYAEIEFSDGLNVLSGETLAGGRSLLRRVQADDIDAVLAEGTVVGQQVLHRPVEHVVLRPRGGVGIGGGAVHSRSGEAAALIGPDVESCAELIRKPLDPGEVHLHGSSVVARERAGLVHIGAFVVQPLDHFPREDVLVVV